MFALGAAIVLQPAWGKTTALGAFLLAVLAEALMWNSDRWKSAAQRLHRNLDFEDSLGWKISNTELADAFARYSGNLEAFVSNPKGTYFASTEPPGAKRAIENVQESSWWSEHLSETMGWLFTGLIVLIIIGCVVLLNVSIDTITPAVSAAAEAGGGGSAVAVVSASVVKIVTSFVLFILTYGVLRYAAGYFSFSLKAKSVKERAEALLENNALSDIHAIKLWQDYHLARAAAPLLPNWVWRVREKKLNELWREYRNTNSTSTASAE
ncbi:MAG TPA: hypothetical protein VK993_04190 [Chthoniobacterales bacterium]|nr:hypothetical protein [Chthoniobacterales bacterium]